MRKYMYPFQNEFSSIWFSTEMQTLFDIFPLKVKSANLRLIPFRKQKQKKYQSKPKNNIHLN